jgi:hypothetical protein
MQKRRNFVRAHESHYPLMKTGRAVVGLETTHLHSGGRDNYNHAAEDYHRRTSARGIKRYIPRLNVDPSGGDHRSNKENFDRLLNKSVTWKETAEVVNGNPTEKHKKSRQASL